MQSYPENPAERTQWILDRRRTVRRLAPDPFSPSGWENDEEPGDHGGSAAVFTVFLTNRECPWRCLMCDLWRYTTETATPPGALPAQLRKVLPHASLRQGGETWIKLYNAGSLFDPGTVPKSDWKAIAELCRPFQRVIVECHPSLVDERILPFQAMLGGAQLEVAMGLETVHPVVLEKLNKRMTLETFVKAATFLRKHSCAVRSFALVRPPFLDEAEARHWACRTIDFAFDSGCNVIAVIPTRTGNGALEELARQGHFAPPGIETLSEVLAYGLSLKRGRVLADLWDLQRFATGEALDAWKIRLARWNRDQRVD
ncbi:MAG TPA: radical SAM protein [Candidatus Limnocylindria bacterium]|nr:radical SAM protein [Candidatus Limnocylindria bacterium]